MFNLDKEKEEALLYLNFMLDKRDEKNLFTSFGFWFTPRKIQEVDTCFVWCGRGGGNKLLWNNFKSIDSFSISPVFTFKTILKDKMYLKVNNRDLVGL